MLSLPVSYLIHTNRYSYANIPGQILTYADSLHEIAEEKSSIFEKNGKCSHCLSLQPAEWCSI